MGFAMVTWMHRLQDFSLSAFKETLWQRVLRLQCINVWKMCGDLSKQNYSIQTCRFFKREKDEASFVAWNGLECVECGSCSYVCPAKRQLKQAIGSMRKTALANRKKK